MDKKRICIVCVIMVFSIMTGYLFEKESKEEISMEPDVVSSISMNRDQYLTVVANRNRIEDKEEFAKLLVKMCRKNSFHTIKFSTDRGYATEIHMQVYLCEEDIKIKEYLLNISKMNYSNYSSVISLELNDISLVDEGYIAYSAAGHGFGNEYPRVYFSSGEKIIIKRKENL